MPDDYIAGAVKCRFRRCLSAESVKRGGVQNSADGEDPPKGAADVGRGLQQ
jgi:hypothetical protein